MLIKLELTCTPEELAKHYFLCSHNAEASSLGGMCLWFKSQGFTITKQQEVKDEMAG